MYSQCRLHANITILPQSREAPIIVHLSPFCSLLVFSRLGQTKDHALRPLLQYPIQSGSFLSSSLCSSIPSDQVQPVHQYALHQSLSMLLFKQPQFHRNSLTSCSRFGSQSNKERVHTYKVKMTEKNQFLSNGDIAHKSLKHLFIIKIKKP